MQIDVWQFRYIYGKGGVRSLNFRLNIGKMKTKRPAS